MPKRGNNRNWGQRKNVDRFNGGGGGGGGNFTYDDIYDHVERRDYKRDNQKRRVSFKPSSGHRGGRGSKISDIAIRTTIAEDTDMGGNDNFDHANFRGRGNRKIRKNSPPPRMQNGRKKLMLGTSGWFQIFIPHGHKYEKDFILKSLCDVIAPDIFIPHYYKVAQNNVTFYVDDHKMAENLLNADRKIQTPDGYRLTIKVKNSIPQVQIDVTLKEQMKMAMVKRYTVATKALDLTKFHSDPDLQDIFCALFRPTIMLAAIDIIAENIPDLEALNLNDNKIHLLDHLKCLATKLPHIKILHMANNKISTATSLDALKGLPIMDLVLEGNPIKDRIKDQTSYISEIRKRLPKVIKLDGIDLPPPIGFDIGDDTRLPSPKASFLCNSSGAEIVRQFLEQYFLIYDSDNRQPLLDAYHEHAMLSLTATYSSTNKLPAYMQYNRNILRISDLEARCRHLKTGRLPVVSFLSELPLTQHDPQSFAVDLTLFSSHLILLTVTGIFKERHVSSNSNQNNSNVLRSFQKSLVIVPAGGGFCIRNETIHITGVTSLQEKKAFKIPATPAPPPKIEPHNIMPSTSQAGITSPTQVQMIEAMSAQSSMSIEWSKKCLEETNWDFQRALFIFMELHKQNKIPPEAFVKF